MCYSKQRRELECLLRNTGLPWSIENGSKHAIVILNGQRIGVINRSHQTGKGKDCKQFKSAIRRIMESVT